MHAREPRGPRHGVYPPVGAAAVAGDGQRDVDHREARADQQHVRGAGVIAADDVQGPGLPRVGDEEGGGTQRRRCRHHQRVGEEGAPVDETDRNACSGTPHVGRPGSDVAHRRQVGRVADRSGQGVVEIGREAGPGQESARFHPGPELASGPADEVGRILGERAHARGRDVQEVVVVRRAVGDAPAPAPGRIHDGDIEGD